MQQSQGCKLAEFIVHQDEFIPQFFFRYGLKGIIVPIVVKLSN